MLFNSYMFIFIFLPIVFIGHLIFNKFQNRKVSKFWLVICSLFFYGYWNIWYLPLIIISLIINFGIGSSLSKIQSREKRKILLVIGISINLALLGYFKYMDFFISNINFIFSSDFNLLNLILPLAISFFTFQQVAYLIDAYRHETKKYDFLTYSLFVTFFPQLIAGPIVYHKEIIPQFEDEKNRKINLRNISLGLFIFFIGLFKKVVIADSFAVWATNGYANPENLTFFEAWLVSLSYTFQLYFDFSGYCDMAIGAALLFNIKLPINFNSPYKALNIQDFWRRWHITLSGFFTKYVYVPLGGNRKGNGRTYVNIFIIFLLSGMWHGAGWTFIFWGCLHGLASVIYRYWNKAGYKMNRILAWFITFNFVNMSWVFFRAQSWSDAIYVLKGMLGLNGVIIPSIVTSNVTILADYAGEFFIRSTVELFTASMMIFIVMLIVIFSKNSIELLKDFRPTFSSAVILAIVAIYGVFNLQRISEFLYFNF